MRALTAEQEQAVARRGEPLLLSAAAGSGKTSVLVERFVRAVREDGVAPGRILALTFTERAAGELRERVRARFLELGEREAARDTEVAFVGTFHGFCARLLRAHPLMAGLDPDFTILDEGFAGRLRDRAFSAALRDFVRDERSTAVDLLAAFGVDRVHAMIAAVHAQLRSQGQRLPRLPSPLAAGAESIEPEQADAAAACLLLDELLAGFGDAYEQLKHARGAVDFDDLELCARELLDERASVWDTWSQRFELLMVDEFQDTNPRQLAILRALDRGNLFTVGDELQSIYGFRHADVSLFRARRAELAELGGSLALRSNFRSRAELLDVVNVAFAERFFDFVPLVAGREEQRPSESEPRAELLLTSRSGWEDGEDLATQVAEGLPTAPLWRQAEARLLATSTCTSARCSCAGCVPWRRSAASGSTSRSAICSRTCARSPTRLTRRRCTRRSPARSPASRSTALHCSRARPARAGAALGRQRATCPR
jgi:ATP-dependent exoDNAse (exonuclease V) beta subunit